MTHCRFFRAIVLCTVLVCASNVAAQDPVIYSDNRTTSSTFRDRGTSYAPTYLIYADQQRTADDAKQLIDELGLPAHLDEYKARAFVVGPGNGTAYGPADLTAFQELLRTRRSSNLKVLGVGAGATFVNSVIAKYAFAVPASSPTAAPLTRASRLQFRSLPTSMRRIVPLPSCTSRRMAPPLRSTTLKRSPPTRIRTRTLDSNASS
jgi:hypothetical protein